MIAKANTTYMMRTAVIYRIWVAPVGTILTLVYKRCLVCSADVAFCQFEARVYL